MKAWLLASVAPMAASGGGGAGINVGPAQAPIKATSTLLTLADNIDTWALIAAIVGIIVGAVMWAFGQFGQNYQQALNGRRGVVVSGIAAVLIGGAPHLVNILWGQGGTVF